MSREQREAENHAIVPELFRLVEMNGLPRFSSWPARLLGLSEWTHRHRNDRLVTAEYSEKRWDEDEALVHNRGI